MSLENYGVLKGRAIEKKAGFGRSTHFHVRVNDSDQDYRIAINIKSQTAPSELLFFVDDHFTHPATEGLEALSMGFHSLKSDPGGKAVDFIRGNLFKPEKMVPLPKDVPGPDNDLNEIIGYFIEKAMRDRHAVLYAFGEKWGPDRHKKDRYFGFLPGNGIHDIHMNQGNMARFTKDDGVWQDGALWIHFPSEHRWVALFLAFQSQAWHTDDRTGRKIAAPAKKIVSPKETIVPKPKEVEPPAVTVPKPVEIEATREGLIRIIAAQVNLPGSDKGKETVTLINRSPDAIDLAGWAVADKHKRKEKIGVLILKPGDTHVIHLSGKATQLTNKGGIITLLDDKGFKIDGVAYTKEAGKAQGWTIVFYAY